MRTAQLLVRVNKIFLNTRRNIAYFKPQEMVLRKNRLESFNSQTYVYLVLETDCFINITFMLLSKAKEHQ